MQTGTTVELEIVDLGSSGEGIGRAEGLAVFVPGALPGDVVTAEITENKGRFAKGRLISVEKPSTDRIEADCPYFGRCGGCSLRNYRYEAQLAWKERFVTENLKRIGSIDDPVVKPILGDPDPYCYRNKAEFAIVKDQVGYYAPGSHTLIPIDECRIQQGPAVALARAMSAFLKKHPKNIYRHLVVRISDEGKIMVILVVNKDEVSRAQELADCLVDAVIEPYELVSIVVNINKASDKQVLGPDCKFLAGPRVLKDHLVPDAGVLNGEGSPLSF